MRIVACCFVLQLLAGHAWAAGLESLRAAGQAGLGYIDLKEIQKVGQDVPKIGESSVVPASRKLPPSGRYVSAGGGRERIVIDQNGRIRTNIQATVYTGQRAPLIFPQSLRWDDLNGRFTAQGNFIVDFVTTAGILRCTWPISMELEFNARGTSLDATVVGAQQYYLDVYGRCQAIGEGRTPFGFVKEEQEDSAAESRMRATATSSPKP